ncbi:prenyltransferase/squalene oxidase repeat-containing protein [Streptomyces roseoverticillatus]|uniref:prenyltransferase/squalene oxidase repeat-containing protein n=1 Tax=Streptomyces roseoverticillatus TaxID=66429 RepID=UPI001F3A66EE|nr:prenyltransferase/squalene oxidase repeat-containing protein [Streptomyces roseoverticillatus]
MESSLFLALLRRVEASPSCSLAGAQVAAYLGRSRGSQGWQAVLARAALGEPQAGDRLLAASYVSGFDHFTGARKKALLTTMFAACGVLPYDRRLAGIELPDAGENAAWTRLVLLAVRVLHGRGTGLPPSTAAGDAEELLRLLRRGSAREVWEGNLLAHLLALHAVHSIDPDAPVVVRGLGVLAARQNPDGGIPFVESHNLFLTAKAGLALVRAGARHGLMVRIGDYVAAGQNPAGGWAYASRVRQIDVDSTAVCVQFLRALDHVRYRPAIERAERLLRSLAVPGGGLPTYRKGEPPEAEMTAAGLIALAPGSQQPDPVLRDAVVFLLDQQSGDGTWPRSWTTSESSVIGRAVHALSCLPSVLSQSLAKRVGRAQERAVARLRETQNKDGGWAQCPGGASDPTSTAHAVAALHRMELRDLAQTGTRWLIAAQRPGGGFHGPADQVGPRPIPYDFPSLPSIHALTALTSRPRPRGRTPSSPAPPGPAPTAPSRRREAG